MGEPASQSGATFSDVLQLQARRITALDPNALWGGFLVGLLDGTTLRLRSLGDIPKHFPPRGNQPKTPAYWCLMCAAVNFCAFTGAAMDCRLAPSTSSEQELACQIILASSSETAISACSASRKPLSAPAPTPWCAWCRSNANPRRWRKKSGSPPCWPTI